MKNNEVRVPKVIKQLHRRMVKEELRHLLTNPIFLGRTAFVCENCYLAFVKPVYFCCRKCSV